MSRKLYGLGFYLYLQADYGTLTSITQVSLHAHLCEMLALHFQDEAYWPSASF
jgi:hypothetical protein